MANLYEIKYIHKDMPKGYMGRRKIWAIDKNKAISCFCTRRPNRDGCTTTKKGAIIWIKEVNEISTSD